METTEHSFLEIPVTQTVLPSGLSVFTIKTKSRLVNVQIAFRVGAFQDGTNPGTAHYLEHIRYEGKSRDGIHPRLKHLFYKGIKSNAFTSPDHTCYWVMGLREYAAEMLEAITRIAFDEEIDQKQVDLERDVIIGEYHERETQIRKHLRINALLYPHVPQFQQHTIGSPESIRNIDAEQIFRFQYAYYTGDHAAILIAGDVNHREMVEAVERLGLSERKGKPIETFVAKPKRFRTAIQDESWPNSITLIFEGPEDDHETVCMNWALRLLDQSTIGLLIQHLRIKDRRVYGVDVNASENPRVIGIGADIQPFYFNYVEEAIFEQVRRLVEMEYPEEYFELLKTKNKIAQIVAEEEHDNGDWINGVMHRWLDQDYKDYRTFRQEMTREQIAEVVKKYLRRDRYGCLHVFRKT